MRQQAIRAQHGLLSQPWLSLSSAAAWQSARLCASLSAMAKQTSRRNFLRTAPVAAAAGITLADPIAALAQGAAMSGEQFVAAAQPFRLFKSTEMEAAITAKDGNAGENRLYESKVNPQQIILTTEKHHSATEFEWHENRDHVMYVLDGSVVMETGGTPKGVKQISPGEWHATSSEGSKSLLMGKGDMLVIPRGTLHKRSTEDSVVFLLISNPAPAKA
jgi:mannose-6-phosphate isomerase-like protein (cupin superfamily)